MRTPARSWPAAGRRTPSPAAAARETHPDEWWAALRDALAATGRAGELDGHRRGGTAARAGGARRARAGRCARPAVERHARRAVDATGWSARWAPSGWAARGGVVPVASFTISKWAWLRRVEPAVAAAARAVHLPHDHLNARLTGGRPPTAARRRGRAGGRRPPGLSRRRARLPAVGLTLRCCRRCSARRERAGDGRPRRPRRARPAARHGGAPGTGDNMAAALGLGSRRARR